MASKYRIEQAKINKKLIGDEVVVSKVKTTDGGKKQKITLADVLEEMRAGFNSVNQRIDNLENRFDNLESRFDNLENRFDKFEKRFDKVVKINKLKE